MDLSAIQTSPKKEVEGVWHMVDSETSVLIARYGNPEFEKGLQKLAMTIPKGLQGRKLSEEEKESYDRGLCELLAQTILIGWKGMRYKGELVEYSVERAAEYLYNPRLKDFREYIIRLSRDAQSYREDEVEETAGN